MTPEQVAANAAAGGLASSGPTTWRRSARLRRSGRALIPPRLRRSSLAELIFVAALALSLALAVQAYAVKPYRIPSGSMEPTLRIGDRLLVDRASHRLGAQPQVGDIVVFHPPAGADAEPPACGSPARAPGRVPCDRPTATAPTRRSSSAWSPSAATRSRCATVT